MSKNEPRLPQILKKYLVHLPVSAAACFYYLFPSLRLKIIGVTGTDGKTTTTSLIYHILKEAGYRVAMVSTVAAKIDGEEIDTGFHVTSPDPWLLQRLLRRMVNHGIEYVVLEVTSHGLDQFRFWGINFPIGVITNVTREHLDYHKTMKDYLKAKAKLFQKVKTGILNQDDSSFDYLKLICENVGAKIIDYGIKGKADFTPKTFSFETSLPGEYNQYNCLAAIAAVNTVGVDKEQIKQGVATFKGVVGRMEEIKNNIGIRTIVDFAHTPYALSQALNTLKKDKKKGKLIVVFGAAGLRDRGKRPLMGKAAGTLADLVVLTAEDPRTEKVEDICQEIAQGCQQAGKKEGKDYFVVYDRGQAIALAINKLAKKGDIVVVCGKGHEKSMCFGKKEYPWSDQEAMKNILKKRGNKK